MEEQKIFSKFIEIISAYVKAAPETLQNATRETHIIQDLKVNSARLVDIIIQAEDTFDIEIDDDDADAIRTIGDAVDVVRQKMLAAA
jgi:acyl carrier protein